MPYPSGSPHDLRGTNKDFVPIPATGSGDNTDYLAMWTAPFDCVVTAMKVGMTDAVTGDNTNRYNFNVDGPNSADEIANLDLIDDVNLAAGVLSSLTMSANVNVDEDESLRLEAEEAGTSPATGPGVWVIEYESR